MIYGQHLDIENEENTDLDINELDYIHNLKTGRLIESSIFLGQVGSSLSEIDSKRLNEFSANIGLAFQIKDDVLDITSSSETLGKSALSDKKNNWYPIDDPEKLGLIAQWLSFGDLITGSSSAARLHDTLFYNEFDIEECRERAHAQFMILDEHLFFQEQLNQSWICDGEKPTIADIACFPYIALSEEGGISRMSYPAIRRWMDRFKRINGFIVMPGVFPAGPGH